MPHTARPPVTLLPNQGWDPRILVCRYALACEDYTLPMHVFIVVGERYVVLADTLVNEDTARALLDIARPHLAGRQLLVVNTHADYDHAWGNQLFAAPDSHAPTPIIGTHGCARRMRSHEERDQLDRLRREQPHTYGQVQLCPPTILFDDALTVDGGDLTLLLMATPGHSPDHCSLYLPEIHTLLAGDAAELPFPFVENTSLADARTSLDKLAALNARMALYCHAPATAGPALLDSNIAYFATLETRCRAALDRGATARPAPDADLEGIVRFPFAEAVPPGAEDWAEPRFYRPGHQAAIRAMLAHLETRSIDTLPGS
jgi:glyoxylase-like metal-dependent hydrolase (beta-lactamase superfamily II)